MPAWAKLITAGLITVICMIVFLLFGVFLSAIIFNLNISDIQNMGSSGNTNALKFLQLIQSIGFFIVPALIIGYLYQGSYKKFLKMENPPAKTTLVIVIMLIFTSMPVINLLAEINTRFLDYLLPANNWMKTMEESTKQTVEVFMNVDSLGGLFFNILMIGILPALGEEMLFRGVGQKLLIDTFKNPHVGIILAAGLFSLMHFEFYTFLPRFAMGIMFGYLFWWSGSLWMSIIPHFINNTLIVIVMYLIHKGQISESIENVGMDKATIIFSISSLIISALLIWLIRKKEKRVL